MKSALPVIGISMGDPAGIGPEICVKALSDRGIYEVCHPLVVGDAACLRYAAERVCRVPIQIHPVSRAADAGYTCGEIDVLDQPSSFSPGRFGCVCAEAGEAAFRAVKEVITLARRGETAACVTAPVNKEALALAGCPFPGHTEIFAHYTGEPRFCMMLAWQRFRVVHVSTHVSLRQACELVRRERVLEVIVLAAKACRELGIERPSVAVAGLNPHAGENGLFGREELEEIIPAVDQARSLGIRATGPLPPDTVFAKAAAGLFDIAVAMYHDQGHIPMKMAGFRFGEESGFSGVNVTLGLPILRVSVDHGTAFDIAGTGRASCESLTEAIIYAVRLAEGRKGGVL